MTEREPGFYWVKQESEWTTAEWVLSYPGARGYWMTPGCDISWVDKDFDEIGPRIEPPKE